MDKHCLRDSWPFVFYGLWFLTVQCFQCCRDYISEEMYANWVWFLGIESAQSNAEWRCSLGFVLLRSETGNYKIPKAGFSKVGSCKSTRTVDFCTVVCLRVQQHWEHEVTWKRREVEQEARKFNKIGTELVIHISRFQTVVGLQQFKSSPALRHTTESNRKDIMGGTT